MQSFCTHLTVHQSLVRAGKEIESRAAAWIFLRVCAGEGYLMNGNQSCEVGPGDVVVVPAAATVRLRASLLNDLRLCHFGVITEQLAGFFTMEEQRALHHAVTHNPRQPHVIQRGQPAAQQHAELCDLSRHAPGIMARTAMLSLAVGTLREVFAAAIHSSAPGGSGRKFLDLLTRLPESELLRRSGRQLAGECGCTERHFRRLFHRRFGLSLKQKQIRWRIECAKKLLLETEAKIIEIASQCGFQGLSQFNHAFKEQTAMTPTRWRKTFTTVKVKYNRHHPELCPRQKNYHPKKTAPALAAG
jgi:AraC-like DNA-binding protein